MKSPESSLITGLVSCLLLAAVVSFVKAWSNAIVLSTLQLPAAVLVTVTVTLVLLKAISESIGASEHMSIRASEQLSIRASKHLIIQASESNHQTFVSLTPHGSSPEQQESPPSQPSFPNWKLGGLHEHCVQIIIYMQIIITSLVPQVSWKIWLGNHHHNNVVQISCLKKVVFSWKSSYSCFSFWSRR